MTSKRFHMVLLLLMGVLLIGLLAGTYGVNSLLSARATKLTSLKAKNQALQQQQTSFQVAKKEIKKYSGLQKITQTVVPEDKNQAEAVREIVNLAAANGIGLTNITFPASTLGLLPTGSTGATSASGVSTPNPALSNPKTARLSQLQPVKNIPGVYNLVITVQSDSANPVAYSKFITFLSALEHNRRTAQVSTIGIEPNNENHNLLAFTLTLNEYIKP